VRMETNSEGCYCVCLKSWRFGVMGPSSTVRGLGWSEWITLSYLRSTMMYTRCVQVEPANLMKCDNSDQGQGVNSRSMLHQGSRFVVVKYLASLLILYVAKNTPFLYGLNVSNSCHELHYPIDPRSTPTLIASSPADSTPYISSTGYNMKQNVIGGYMVIRASNRSKYSLSPSSSVKPSPL